MNAPEILYSFYLNNYGTTLPKNVKTLTLEPYDGTTNTDDHLAMYKAHIYV